MEKGLSMKFKAVLFDLDGTLADTALDLAGALNDVLRQKGLPEKALVDIRPHTSHGSVALLGFGAGITPEMPKFKEWQTAYLNRYGERFAQDTVLFDDVNEVLAVLHQRNMKWGIVTNKHARFTNQLVPKLGFLHTPDIVVSGDTCAHSKPNPEPLLYACQKLGLQPQQCLYVGDAERDIQAGNNAGMKTVLAEWGYLSEQDRQAEWGATWQLAQIRDLLTIL